MTALANLFRTTAFKLSLAYLLIFSIGAGVIIGWVGWNVRRLLDEQIAATVEAEINGLSEQYARGGIRVIVDVIERRTRQPGASLYLVTNFAGQAIAGNIAQLPSGVLDQPGVRETTYERQGELGVERRALARIFLLPGGFRLLVGRDLEDREALRRVFSRALLTSLFWLIVIGTIGGLLVARRVLRRVDGMNDSVRSIMSGDLSRRLPLSRANDELERLAINLNSMLDRIVELMKGLREVSDNIAHDLKTPLTRLRNRAEEALRIAQTPDEFRGALEKTIEESDTLIRIFNALLMIARMEAGSEIEGKTDFDAGDVARDLVELYEPAAEDAQMRIETDIGSGLTVHGSRELIGQALANLIDNALKYGASPNADHPSIVRVSAAAEGGQVLLRVGDRGPGIAASEREHVLGRFVRLEGSRSRPGSGLGLSLAAAVARLHNGEIRIEDNAPGLLVTLVIPAAAAPPVQTDKTQADRTQVDKTNERNEKTTVETAR
ncbi:ATP-binding protein [Methylocella sp. CPCC 101449]|uniref:sensor histidine kinase n=1 Tax=Methylocella sp. CPCC 101449 TaxID=2987531 RepID=UPI002890287A|nr:ATP-binding protein [Methylocella sp. CPCC 101449]MDT2024233.1 HAMP domain-containing histidine kinase [Methylocella sp. CPCC 101449]